MSKRLSNRFSKAKDVTPKGKTVDHYYRTLNGQFFNQSTDQEQPMLEQDEIDAEWREVLDGKSPRAEATFRPAPKVTLAERTMLVMSAGLLSLLSIACFPAVMIGLFGKQPLLLIAGVIAFIMCQFGLKAIERRNLIEQEMRDTELKYTQAIHDAEIKARAREHVMRNNGNTRFH